MVRIRPIFLIHTAVLCEQVQTRVWPTDPSCMVPIGPMCEMVIVHLFVILIYMHLCQQVTKNVYHALSSSLFRQVSWMVYIAQVDFLASTYNDKY